MLGTGATVGTLMSGTKKRWRKGTDAGSQYIGTTWPNKAPPMADLSTFASDFVLAAGFFAAGVAVGFWVCAVSAEKAHPGRTCEQAQSAIDERS